MPYHLIMMTLRSTYSLDNNARHAPKLVTLIIDLPVSIKIQLYVLTLKIIILITLVIKWYADESNDLKIQRNRYDHNYFKLNDLIGE